jgi:predicted nucleic acid-binding protein
MIVISDTTPLISLMKIGQLDLINQLFGEIQVPEAVFKELTSNNRFQNECRQIEECPFINRVTVTDTKSVDLLRRSSGLDLGESEAIILSDYFNANYLLMDESKGRKVAQQMGIPIMGTIGMLMIAYNEHLLSKEEILNCINILKNSGRHISEQLYEQLIKKFYR